MAAGGVDLEGHAVLADFQRADFLGKMVGEGRDAFDPGEVGVDADVDLVGVEGLVQRGDPGVEALVSGEVGDFKREDPAELVGDQAGHLVGVAVDRAVGFGGLVELEDPAAEFGRALDGTEKEILADDFAAVVEHPQRHAGLRVPEAAAEGLAFLVEDFDQRARFGVAGDLADHAGPDRGVVAEVFETDGRHGRSVGRGRLGAQ